MKLIFLLLFAFYLMPTAAQRAQKSIRVKVDFIHPVSDDSAEVWLRRQDPHRATVATYFYGTLPLPLPDSIKLGNYVRLYLRAKDNPGCFRFKRATK